MKVTVLANCQCQPFTGILRAVTGLDDVKGYVVMEAASRAEEIRARLDASDLILSQVIRNHALDWIKTSANSDDARYHVIPNIFVSTFHPDVCYIGGPGQRVVGPMGDYHSAIALHSFLDGLDAEEAVRQFNADRYHELGYFERKGRSESGLVSRLEPFGVDIRGILGRFDELGVYMYTVNHPNNAAIAVIVDEIVERLGLPRRFDPLTVAALLPEYLKQGPCWPVYPEIAARLGINGSYVFRQGFGRKFGFLTLNEFVSRSYDTFSRHDRAALTVRDPDLRALLDRRVD